MNLHYCYRYFIVLAIVLYGFLISPISAAIFVKIPDIPGDVTVRGYDDGKWVEAKSGSYGADRELPTSDEKGGSEYITIGAGDALPVGLVAFLGTPTAPLLQASINGNSIGDVEIHLVDVVPGDDDELFGIAFSIIKLRRAFVQSFDTRNAADDLPWYQVKLLYSSIEVINRADDPSEGKSVRESALTWNLAVNQSKLSVISRISFLDTDKDGMSDEFELTHFGSSTGGEASFDSDGDGESNLAEFLAHTNPKDHRSAFYAKITEAGDNKSVIEIKTEPGRVYQLRRSDDLGVFFLLGDNVVGNGDVAEFLDPNPGLRRFYQVTIIPAE